MNCFKDYETQSFETLASSTVRGKSDYPQAVSYADRRGEWLRRWHGRATPAPWRYRLQASVSQVVSFGTDYSDPAPRDLSDILLNLLSCPA